MKRLCVIFLVVFTALVAVGCRGVDLGIRQQETYAEAAPGEITVVVRNDSRNPLGLLAVTLAVGELRMQRSFATVLQVAYDPEKGEAVTVSAQSQKDITQSPGTPRRHFEWRGDSSGVLLEHMLMPGDEVEVTVPFTPYPHLGDRVTATAELIRVGEVYKRQKRMVATQKVEREGPDGVKRSFVEKTTTTIYVHMNYPVGSGAYLIRREDYDSRRRVAVDAKTSLDIRPLGFTFAAAVEKAGFEPDGYRYFHAGGMWLFCHDEETWFVSPDVLEHYPGDYRRIADALEHGDDMVRVEIRDEISRGACPLLSLLYEAGYARSKSIEQRSDLKEEAWNLSGSLNTIDGYIRIKDKNLLQFARCLEEWGYRADGGLLRKR